MSTLLEYKRSKRKQLRGLATALVLLGTALLLAWYNRFSADQPMRGLDYAWSALAGISLYFVFRNVLNKPVVRLSSKGLYARSLGNATIKLGYIQRFELLKHEGEEYILARSRNQDKMLAELNSAQRTLLRANMKGYGEALLLPVEDLSVAPNEAIIQLNEGLKRLKSKS